MENKSEDIMFLFGAGISIPIGIPAMKGIYKSYMDKKKSGISDKSKRTCEFFIKEMGVNPDLEEFLLAANSIIEFSDSKLNKYVEKNISRIKTSSKIKDYNKNLCSNLKDVVQVKKGILDFLSRICFQFDREKALKINLGFVKALSQLGYSVYSTNYDFAFEYVALEKDIIINDNFIKEGQRFLWNDKIHFDEKGGFKLIKLHGSVTWYTEGNGDIEKIYSSTDINPAGKEVEKIVIVPTRFKDIYDKHFFALYSHFLGSLAKAKIIVIAGHSLRDDYLRAGIIERFRNGNFQVIVIDPTYPQEIKKDLHPARLGTIGDVIHLPYKWEEISDELSYILLNSPAEEIIKKCVHILKKHKYTKNKIKIKGNIGILRPHSTKEISINVDAFLPVDSRPSNLKVWLKAAYKDTEGKIQHKVYNEFIEIDKINYGDALSGLISVNEKIKIKVPNISKWLKVNASVKLVVGIVKANIKKPLSARDNNVIVKYEKEVNYKI